MRNRFVKYSFLTISCLVFCLFINLPAWSYTVGTTDVGAIDGLLEKTKLSNSGKDNELTWVNSILNPDTSFSYKIDTGFDWKETNKKGIWANSLIDSPDYFLIKTGGNTITHYLFENLDSKSYAVIDLSMFDAPGESSGLTVSGISHITVFGGSPAIHHNPEPATMLLLGFGLIGLAGISRRKK